MWRFCPASRNSIGRNIQKKKSAVTAGYGQIVIGEDIFDIKKGSAIFIPSMANHRLINLGDENLEMICIVNTLKGGFFDGGFDKLFTDGGWTKVS